jgi:Rod binding domain-containing protein
MALAREVMSLEDIASTVRKFESCEFTPQQFHHRDHLTVIACYLEQMPLRQALKCMRDALKKFTAHHKAKGYNETITRFWIAKVAQILATEGETGRLPELIEQVHAALGSKELLFQYYSRELVLSEQAKAEWIGPDLKEW